MGPDLQAPALYQPAALPSKTYALDLMTGRVRGTVDGLEAIRQFITKTLLTTRYAYLIYPDEYGTERDEIIGSSSSALMEAEIERVVTEALIYDERILAVRDFIYSKQDDQLTVIFTVDTVAGTIQIQGVDMNV
ncbi:Protein of unknown function [Paenibacillaceae bacterium GAS479]|nr:Protein of unknown function [Paenibacillaceae bacterium GAS479]